MANIRDPDRFLLKRGRRWYYQRRVPGQFSHLDQRRFAKVSLKTDSLEIARLRRDHLAEADDEYWMALAIELAEDNANGPTVRAALEHRYKAAISRAMAYGFSYKPAEPLAESRSIAELMERIKTLVRKKFYDGIVFHRVIGGFMAQTGDPTGTGRGGSDLPDLEAEFSKEPFKRGILGMARSADPHSANSQFFIMFAAAPHLNNQYTVVGKVTKGMEFIDNITRGQPPANPDKIIKMRTSDQF